MENKITPVAAHHTASLEARLWQAVLVRTIEEWVSGPLRRKRVAEQYLFDDNSDFRLVCEAAGMNAETLRARLARLRKQSLKEIDCQIAA